MNMGTTSSVLHSRSLGPRPDPPVVETEPEGTQYDAYQAFAGQMSAAPSRYVAPVQDRVVERTIEERPTPSETETRRDLQVFGSISEAIELLRAFERVQSSTLRDIQKNVAAEMGNAAAPEGSRDLNTPDLESPLFEEEETEGLQSAGSLDRIEYGTQDDAAHPANKRLLSKFFADIIRKINAITTAREPADMKADRRFEVYQNAAGRLDAELFYIPMGIRTFP